MLQDCRLRICELEMRPAHRKCERRPGQDRKCKVAQQLPLSQMRLPHRNCEFTNTNFCCKYGNNRLLKGSQLRTLLTIDDQDSANIYGQQSPNAPPSSPPLPPVHQDDADENDETVKQLNQCSSLYLSLQDCLINTDGNWKSCQKEVQALKACNERRQKDKKS
uniref:Uncharacterized protein LOC104214430 n=1 Tax=Nicotiana sylvestris TaxID=4096 RepID=A0A1U7V2C8_NICSY|nr:PREDICTED: uncharacterized protein LOC104214430 [Nicotiana sylvestris]